MRRLIILCAILSSPALATEFRGSQIGGSCESIDSREEALGSKLLQSGQGNPAFHVFQSRAFDRSTVIHYLCKDGLLVVADYAFAKYGYDEAVSNFNAAFGGIASQYGTASSEYSPSEPQEFPRAGSSNPAKYYAVWNGPGHFVTVSLMLDGDAAGPNWHVLVTVSLPGDRSRSN
jgi:hypothetical protein